ncbi:MAG: hypothetical protein AB7N65_10805 [Vicinamibacterales bacterium]
MDAMNRYLTGVLSVIAAGVLVTAYAAYAAYATYAAHTAHTAHTPVSLQTVAPAVQPAPPPPEATLVGAPSGPWPRPIIGAAPADWHEGRMAPSAGERWMAVPATAFLTANGAEPVGPPPAVQAVRAVEFEAAPRRVARRSIAREGRRNWKKTAMVIGGTTAASAGIGGIFGGKKGALIGAAIGGGASTLYETIR